ncbi:MAG: efflux RND transporter periplasmic adaptor subunit [Calditrichia bacterium]
MYKIIIIIFIFMTGSLLVQCSGDSSAEQQTPSFSGTPIRTIVLEPRPFSEYLQLTGTVEARNRIKIIVEEGGTLQKIIKDKGNMARTSDTLAILENRILKAGYDEARAALHQAQLDFDSKKVLHDKRAISENEFLVSKFGLERAEAAYQLANARYSKLFIAAPLNGYVNDRMYDRGSYVMPMTPIFDFIDNAVMKIKAGIAERFLSDIQIGTPAEITFDAFPEMQLTSTVSFLNRSIDPQSRTFQIEIEIPNPDRKLAPQMIANIKLLRRSYKDQIVIPLDAIIESETGRYVFVNNNNLAEKVPVELLAVYGDSVLVTGLESERELVVVGQQELTEGDSLLVKNN